MDQRSNLLAQTISTAFSGQTLLVVSFLNTLFKTLKPGTTYALYFERTEDGLYLNTHQEVRTTDTSYIRWRSQIQTGSLKSSPWIRLKLLAQRILTRNEGKGCPKSLLLKSSSVRLKVCL